MSDKPKNSGRFAKGNPGKPKGAVTKSAALIREMVAKALDQAGGVDYLARQAEETPAAFLALVGRVIPMQVTGEEDGPLKHSITVTFRGA